MYYDQRINYMSGQNAMYCNYCKNTCISAMCTNLAFGPEVIIIILNRGQGIQYKVKINFFEDLNLYNFIEYKETGVNYKLIGVVTHLGENDSSGHFIAYCKNPINLKWYQFNDSVVNEVINFKAEVIDYAMPYLLFYQKITSQQGIKYIQINFSLYSINYSLFGDIIINLIINYLIFIDKYINIKILLLKRNKYI